MVSIVDNLLFLQRRRFLSQACATPCLSHCENQNHYCHTDYQLHKSWRLSNLIHILLFKLLSILHVHSWHSDLSLRLWGPWSLNVLTISFVFLWVRGPAIMKTVKCYFSVGLPRTVCSFVSLTIDNILQQYVPRNTVAKFYPNCFLLLLWKIRDQTISLDWRATNSARSFTFQPQVAQALYESLYGKNRVWNLDEINEVKAIKVINKV